MRLRVMRICMMVTLVITTSSTEGLRGRGATAGPAAQVPAGAQEPQAAHPVGAGAMAVRPGHRAGLLRRRVLHHGQGLHVAVQDVGVQVHRDDDVCTHRACERGRQFWVDDAAVDYIAFIRPATEVNRPGRRQKIY